MNSRFESHRPHHYAQQRDQRPRHLLEARHPRPQQCARAHEHEPIPLVHRSEQEGNEQNAEQVVHRGQGEQKAANLGGQALRKDCQNGEGKRDIGSRRNSPATQRLWVERGSVAGSFHQRDHAQVDDGWRNHSAHCGDHRHGSALGVG